MPWLFPGLWACLPTGAAPGTVPLQGDPSFDSTLGPGGLRLNPPFGFPWPANAA